MSQTRADLDQKLTRLEARARAISPRRVARRYAPAMAQARVIAAIAALIGAAMAVRRYRNGGRRARMRAELASYGRW